MRFVAHQAEVILAGNSVLRVREKKRNSYKLQVVVKIDSVTQGNN